MFWSLMAEGPHSSLRETDELFWNESDTHTLNLNLTLSQFVFPVIGVILAQSILETGFVCDSKMQEGMKMNAADHDWTGKI